MIRFNNKLAYDQYREYHLHYTRRIRDCEYFLERWLPVYESAWARGDKKKALRLSRRLGRINGFKVELERFFYLRDWGTNTGHVMEITAFSGDQGMGWDGIAKKPQFDEYGYPDGELNGMTFGFINHGRNWRNPSWSMHT